MKYLNFISPSQFAVIALISSVLAVSCKPSTEPSAAASNRTTSQQIDKVKKDALEASRI
jgi:hypothetical protein